MEKIKFYTRTQEECLAIAKALEPKEQDTLYLLCALPSRFFDSVLEGEFKCGSFITVYDSKDKIELLVPLYFVKFFVI